MSEYQYYEFQAVDRPLTPQQMTELRALTTRATITPMRLQNVYHWGSFKGDPHTLMETYFDAFVYVANWGTHWFMLALPRRLLDERAVQPYADGEVLRYQASGERLILEFTAGDEDGAGWVEDEEAASWMPALLPLRAELAGGDPRALYLGWLAAASDGSLADDKLEPPVPAGLGQLSAPLTALAEFLSLDEDLLAVAAARSPEHWESAEPGDLEQWVVGLPDAEKDALLVRLARGEDAHLHTEILRRFRETHAPRPAAPAGGRSVGELLSAAEDRSELRQRQEAERRAAAEARRRQEQEAARARHLEGLAGREDELWSQAEALIEAKRPKEYDQAVQLLTDLRDLSLRRQGANAYAARLASLRDRYARRPSLLERMDRAGLQE